MKYTEKELQQERWKPIFGYDGLYEVSDLGRVRSKHSGEWTVLRPAKNPNGYLSVMLYKYGNGKNYYIHQLVARYFVPNDNLFNTEINHIDECKQNNRVSNIEWCDRYYNMHYNGLYKRRKQYIHTQPVRGKLKELYRPELSYKENLELFKSNGIECCRDTVWKLRKDLGLTKNNSNQ